MLTGRIRRKERSFYGAEPALEEKVIRDRYRGYQNPMATLMLLLSASSARNLRDERHAFL